jgi:hypothetical protein
MSDLQRNPLFRYLSIGLMAMVIIAFFQYARPVYIWFYHKVWFFYTWGPTKWLISTADNLLPFDFSHPLSMVKLVTSLIHLLCIVGIIHLWFLDGRITRMAIYIILGWFAAGIALNLVGRAMHSASVLLDARTLIDYLLQPFGIVFILPVLILYRKQLPPKSLVVKHNRASRPLSDDEVMVTD